MWQETWALPQFLTGETGAQSISERLSVLAFWVQSGRAAEGLPINRGDRGGGGKSGSLNATACGRGAALTAPMSSARLPSSSCSSSPIVEKRLT